jgi:hypothetical protein
MIPRRRGLESNDMNELNYDENIAPWYLCHSAGPERHTTIEVYFLWRLAFKFPFFRFIHMLPI